MTTLDLEVFRAGDYGERGAWPPDALDAIAADYNPAVHEAPVTVDHARSGPALGWVSALRRVGDVLVARLRDLDPAFAEMIRAGAFKKRSVEIYPQLNETGRPYLRAVSFLGACPPAVKGLADVVFAEGEGEPAVVEFDERPSIDSAFASLCERLMAGGRWRPAWEEQGIGEFWNSLPAEAERAWFAAFLEAMPEVAATQPLGRIPLGAAPASEGLPSASSRVDLSTSSVALHRRAVAFREEHPGVTYAEALRSVAQCA